EGIPRKFLEAILLDLKHQGLLSSQRGPGGGYALRLPPEEITVASVVRALHGSPPTTFCALSAGPCPECATGTPCQVGRLLLELHHATAAILERTTIADLTRRAEEEPSAPLSLERPKEEELPEAFFLEAVSG